MSVAYLHGNGMSSEFSAVAPDAMSTLLAQLELAQRACQTATGNRVRMGLAHWGICSVLVEAGCPTPFVEICRAFGDDFHDFLGLKPVLSELVADGMVAKVRRPPTPTDPNGSGHRYMATHNLRMAARFLAADFKPAD